MAEDQATALSLEEEERLVYRLKDGDARALEPLWRAYSRQLHAAVIFPVLPQRELAEEVLQNTFIKAFERIEGYTWQERGILPWLKTIARNMAMDVHRRHQRTEVFCRGYGHFVEASEPAMDTHQRPDKALEQARERQTIKVRVKAVLDSGQLNDRYKEAIELRLFQELDRETCAEIMNVKIGTFDVLFHRALKRFETIYRQLFGDPSEEEAGGLR